MNTPSAAFITVFCITLLSGPAVAQLNFINSEIPRGDSNEILLEDMDGDGRKDIVVPQWSADAGRELHIFLQQENGRFPSEPSRRVEIKPEIIAFALADVRPEPGHEILLFTGTSVFSLSSAQASYTGNLERMFDWEFVAAIPDRRQVLYFPKLFDLDNDGNVDLLLPGREEYGFFHGNADGSFTLMHSLNPVNQQLDPSEVPLGNTRINTTFTLNEREGIVLSVTAVSNSPFHDFLLNWNDDEATSMLETEHWIPSVTTARMNSDERDDIVYMNIGNDLYGQINILLQRDDGTYADKPDWQGSIDTKGDIRLLDINGDKRSDFLRVLNNGSDWDIQFFLNKDGTFTFAQPDQVMKFSGYDLTLAVTDIHNDGHTQLSITYFTIPVIGAVRNASVVRTQLLFAASTTGNQIFNSRPDFKLDETFAATEVRGLSSQINLQTDIDNDGHKDALYLTNEGTVAAKTIDSSLRFANTPFWQYVPARTVLRFTVDDLNGDGTPDIILYHSSHMTALVSAQ